MPRPCWQDFLRSTTNALSISPQLLCVYLFRHRTNIIPLNRQEKPRLHLNFLLFHSAISLIIFASFTRWIYTIYLASVGLWTILRWSVISFVLIQLTELLDVDAIGLNMLVFVHSVFLPLSSSHHRAYLLRTVGSKDLRMSTPFRLANKTTYTPCNGQPLRHLLWVERLCLQVYYQIKHTYLAYTL